MAYGGLREHTALLKEPRLVGRGSFGLMGSGTSSKIDSDIREWTAHYRTVAPSECGDTITPKRVRIT